jgi:putative oxidoreductase
MHPLRDLALLGGRGLVGGYVAAHGAQKLLGAFGGKGLQGVSTEFERMGLTPGRSMALLGGSTEILGGALTALGIAHPIGELMIAGDMAVATAARRARGPFNAQRGFELPATNLALAAVLATTGPGPLRLGPNASRRMTLMAMVGGAAVAASIVSKMARAKRAEPPAPSPDAADLRDSVAALAAEQAAWVPVNV